MLNSRLLALGAALTGLGAPAFAEMDYSSLGVSLGMSVEEAKIAASQAGLDHTERYDSYFYNMVEFGYEVDGTEVELMIEDVVGKHDYRNTFQDTKPDTPTILGFYYFLGASSDPSVYSLRSMRHFDEGLPKQDVVSWIREKAGGQRSDCVYEQTGYADERLSIYRYLFDADGTAVAHEDLCEELELPLEPGWGVAEALNVRELGATHGVDFTTKWSVNAPETITNITISMVDLEAVAAGVEAKKREFSEAASPLSALSDM